MMMTSIVNRYMNKFITLKPMMNFFSVVTDLLRSKYSFKTKYRVLDIN